MAGTTRPLPQALLIVAALVLSIASSAGSLDVKGDVQAIPTRSLPGAQLPPLGLEHSHQAGSADLLAEPGAGGADATTGPKVSFQLEVVKKTINVLGVPVEAWTFNGVVPGPILRVEEGTRVEIVLVNGHDQAHSIHTHLRGNLLASDGSSDTAPLPVVPHQHNPWPVQQNPVGPYEPRADRDVADPGQSYTYNFEADTPGTYLYHCHVFVATEHISRGLFGLIVVYPKGWKWTDAEKDPINGNTKARVTDAQGRPYYEDVVMISELTPAMLPSPGAAIPNVPWYPAGVSTSGMTPPGVGKIHLANFRAWNDPYTVGPVRPNERVLIRVANIGDELHDWHVHSHWFDVLDKISREKKPLYTADTLLMGPGDSFETVLTAQAPGYWFMHDHIVPEAYTGMVPWLRIEGDPLPNTPPEVLVDDPIDGAVVAGRVRVAGTADDFNGREMVRRVEVRVDEQAWQLADGRLDWRFAWDTTEVRDGMHTLRVRAFDGRNYSADEIVVVNVRNGDAPLARGNASAPSAQGAPASGEAAKSPPWGPTAALGALALAAVIVARRRA